MNIFSRVQSNSQQTNQQRTRPNNQQRSPNSYNTPRNASTHNVARVAIIMTFKSPLADGTDKIVLRYRRPDDFYQQLKSVSDMKDDWGAFEDLFGKIELLPMSDIGRIKVVELNV